VAAVRPEPPRRARTRYRVTVRRALALVTALLGAAVLAGCGTRADVAEPPVWPPPPTAASPAPSTVVPSPSAIPATAGPLFTPGRVTLRVTGYWSWAYLDFATGALAGSTPATATSDTASMSKAWVAADYLRRAAERKQRPSATILAQLSTMIRDSDTTHVFEFHVANGNLSSLQRMIKLCALTDTKGFQNSWSLTQMSTRDVTRLAKCIADGRAAGPQWTEWLLTEMRNVRGAGRFGIIEALPADVAATTAIKNGWLARDDGLWHIACMAIGGTWSIGVMARYPSALGKDYGAGTCREVTAQLLTRP